MKGKFGVGSLKQRHENVDCLSGNVFARIFGFRVSAIVSIVVFFEATLKTSSYILG